MLALKTMVYDGYPVVAVAKTATSSCMLTWGHVSLAVIVSSFIHGRRSNSFRDYRRYNLVH